MWCVFSICVVSILLRGTSLLSLYLSLFISLSSFSIISSSLCPQYSSSHSKLPPLLLPLLLTFFLLFFTFLYYIFSIILRILGILSTPYYRLYFIPWLFIPHSPFSFFFHFSIHNLPSTTSWASRWSLRNPPLSIHTLVYLPLLGSSYPSSLLLLPFSPSSAFL